MNEDGTTPLWAKCSGCGHCWAAAYYPIDLMAMGQALKNTRRPKGCSAAPLLAKQDAGELQEPGVDSMDLMAAERLWASLRAKQADKWARVAETMRAAGYDIDKGARLLMPSHLVDAQDGPAWVVATSSEAVQAPSMVTAEGFERIMRPAPVELPLDAPTGERKGRLLFWFCPKGCGTFVDWNKTVTPAVATCRGCGASSADATAIPPASHRDSRGGGVTDDRPVHPSERREGP